MGINIWELTEEEGSGVVAGPVASVWAPGFSVEVDPPPPPPPEEVFDLFLDTFTGSGSILTHTPEVAPSGFAYLGEIGFDPELTGAGSLASGVAVSSATESGWSPIIVQNTVRLIVDANIIGPVNNIGFAVSFQDNETTALQLQLAVNELSFSNYCYLNLFKDTGGSIESFINIPEAIPVTQGTWRLEVIVDVSTGDYELAYSGTSLASSGTASGTEIDCAPITEVVSIIFSVDVNTELSRVGFRTYSGL